MTQPTADDGAERLRQETLRLQARIADLEAQVHELRVAGSRARRVPGGQAIAYADARVSAPTRLADAARVLVRGVSVGLIRQVEFTFDVMGSFANALLGRRPVEPVFGQRNRRPDTSQLGRWRE